MGRRLSCLALIVASALTTLTAAVEAAPTASVTLEYRGPTVSEDWGAINQRLAAGQLLSTVRVEGNGRTYCSLYQERFHLPGCPRSVAALAAEINGVAPRKLNPGAMVRLPDLEVTSVTYERLLPAATAADRRRAARVSDAMRGQLASAPVVRTLADGARVLVFSLRGLRQRFEGIDVMRARAIVAAVELAGRPDVALEVTGIEEEAPVPVPPPAVPASSSGVLSPAVAAAVVPPGAPAVAVSGSGGLSGAASEPPQAAGPAPLVAQAPAPAFAAAALPSNLAPEAPVSLPPAAGRAAFSDTGALGGRWGSVPPETLIVNSALAVESRPVFGALGSGIWDRGNYASAAFEPASSAGAVSGGFGSYHGLAPAHQDGGASPREPAAGPEAGAGAARQDGRLIPWLLIGLCVLVVGQGAGFSPPLVAAYTGAGLFLGAEAADWTMSLSDLERMTGFSTLQLIGVVVMLLAPTLGQVMGAVRGRRGAGAAEGAGGRSWPGTSARSGAGGEAVGRCGPGALLSGVTPDRRDTKVGDDGPAGDLVTTEGPASVHPHRRSGLESLVNLRPGSAGSRQT